MKAKLAVTIPLFRKFPVLGEHVVCARVTKTEITLVCNSESFELVKNGVGFTLDFDFRYYITFRKHVVVLEENNLASR